jgi:hypothetical protein
MNRLSRRTLFWSGLFVLVVAFVMFLIVAYRQQQQAPLTLKLIFDDTRKERLRNVQLVLTGQQAREPLFDGQLFIGLEDTPLKGDYLTVYRAPYGTYAREEKRMSLVRNGDWLHTNAAATLVDFHPDPADRFITATALLHGATLVTADDRILRWSGTLQQHAARQ